MARAGLAALVIANLVCVGLGACLGGTGALAQGIPLPPKKPPQPVQTAQPPQPSQPPQASQQVRPRPTINEAAIRPGPVRPPGDAVPYDGSQRALVDRISAYLSSVQTLIGDFVQIGPDGGRTVGKVYIQKPGRVRFEYQPPSAINVIADGSVVVVRDRRLATQDLYPLSQTPLRFLLADQIDLARDTNLVSVSRDNTFVTVTIEERQLLVGTHRLMLMFNAKDLALRQWTVTDPQGYDTTVAIYNIDTTHKPDPTLFNIN
jgi:outer membrane lipoprotein-sorting protein